MLELIPQACLGAVVAANGFEALGLKLHLQEHQDVGFVISDQDHLIGCIHSLLRSANRRLNNLLGSQSRKSKNDGSLWLWCESLVTGLNQWRQVALVADSLIPFGRQKADDQAFWNLMLDRLI